jgi:hypothetical protein
MKRTFTIGEVADALIFQRDLDNRASVSSKTTVYNSDHNYNAYLSELMFKDHYLLNRKDWESGSTGDKVKADTYDYKVGLKRWDVKAIGTNFDTVIINSGKWGKAMSNKTWLAFYRIINDLGEELGACHPKDMRQSTISDPCKEGFYIIDINSLKPINLMI